MTTGWHYAKGEKTVGPIDENEMQIVLSKLSDPRKLRVWKVGFKDWECAGDVQDLAQLIYKPPPLAGATRLSRKVWVKFIYGFGVLALLAPFVGGDTVGASLIAVLTLDDIRTD